jgi:hypothetical protein
MSTNQHNYAIHFSQISESVTLTQSVLRHPPYRKTQRSLGERYDQREPRTFRIPMSTVLFVGTTVLFYKYVDRLNSNSIDWGFLQLLVVDGRNSIPQFLMRLNCFPVFSTECETAVKKAVPIW